jgi:hypothetical protein
MQSRGVGFVELPAPGASLPLPPGLTAGMPMGMDVAASEPAVVGTIRLWTAVRVRVDRPSASSGEAEDRRWRARCLGGYLGALRPGLTPRLVDESGEGVKCFGASALGLLGFGGRFGRPGRGVGQPTLEEEAEQHESAQQELGKQRVGDHGGAPCSPECHRGLLPEDSRWNYPLSRGTRPNS